MAPDGGKLKLAHGVSIIHGRMAMTGPPSVALN